MGDDGRPSQNRWMFRIADCILGKFYNDEQGLRDIWSNPSHRKSDLLNKLKEMNIGWISSW